MDQQVVGVAAAANGGIAGQAGLARMAEALRVEIDRPVDGDSGNQPGESSR